MTLPWSKLPRCLVADPRYTLLSVEGDSAYAMARYLADDAGQLWGVGDEDASATLAAVVARKRPNTDPKWATAAVAECVARNLLTVTDDGTGLRVVDWLLDSLAVADVGPPIARPSSAPRAPGRPRHGAAPMSSTERSLRRRFDRREGPRFRDVPAGVTWEQWTADSVPATKLLGASNETPPHATKPCNETMQRNPAAGRADSETSEPSGTSERREEGDSDRASDVRGAQRNTATKLVASGDELPIVVRCGTLENVAHLDVMEVLSRMDSASEGHIGAMLHTPADATAFGALVRDLVARGQTTIEGLVCAARHAPHDPWVSQQGRLPLRRLMAKEATILLNLIAGSSTCPNCGGAPLAAVSEASSAERSAWDAEIAARRAAYHATPIETGTTR